MTIQIEPHTLQRAIERGATEEEIIEVLQSGVNILGKFGRLGKSKTFAFNTVKIGKFYEEKKVEVYYIIEQQSIITVTVYVYYGKF
jgi:hypothetical protein